MVKEYISREVAISKIRDQRVLGGDYDAYEREEDVVDMLNSIPAADVVERKKGKWINEHQEGLGSFSAECSLCGKRTLAYFHYFYCPNCGAKMDGGQEE